MKVSKPYHEPRRPKLECWAITAYTGSGAQVFRYSTQERAQDGRKEIQRAYRRMVRAGRRRGQDGR